MLFESIVERAIYISHMNIKPVLKFKFFILTMVISIFLWIGIFQKQL